MKNDRNDDLLPINDNKRLKQKKNKRKIGHKSKHLSYRQCARNRDFNSSLNIEHWLSWLIAREMNVISLRYGLIGFKEDENNF